MPACATAIVASSSLLRYRSLPPRWLTHFIARRFGLPPLVSLRPPPPFPRRRPSLCHLQLPPIPCPLPSIRPRHLLPIFPSPPLLLLLLLPRTTPLAPWLQSRLRRVPLSFSFSVSDMSFLVLLCGLRCAARSVCVLGPGSLRLRLMPFPSCRMSWRRIPGFSPDPQLQASSSCEAKVFRHRSGGVGSPCPVCPGRSRLDRLATPKPPRS